MPALKVPSSFPGVDKLPESVQKVLQALFPADDVMSPAVPGTVVTGSAKGLLEALKPMSKGSVQKGIDLAPEVMRTKDEWLPLEYPLTAHPTVQEMWHLLRKPESGPDYLKVLAGEKMSSRPPMTPKIEATEGFYFGGRQRSGKPTVKEATIPPMSRDPLADEMTKRYRKFDLHQQSLNRHSRGCQQKKKFSQ